MSEQIENYENDKLSTNYFDFNDSKKYHKLIVSQYFSNIGQRWEEL